MAGVISIICNHIKEQNLNSSGLEITKAGILASYCRIKLNSFLVCVSNFALLFSRQFKISTFEKCSKKKCRFRSRRGKSGSIDRLMVR
jgi:hypothetical protein